MSAAAAATAATPAAPAKGKKKLIILIAVAVLVLTLGGVGALLLLKKNAAHDDEEAEAPDQKPAATQRASGSPPVFAPLEPFTVNLADKDAERYAQVGITLEMTDQGAAESLKTFMPAIRNNVLMLLPQKTSTELRGREEKEQLAREVRRETARALGYELPDEDEQADAEEASPKKKKRSKAEPALPILAVYFSTFIIQ
jgi:flagellar protein FliL